MAAADELIGKTVAKKYRVEQMIGEGGMGKVYRATQVALDKPVVLKVLRQALLSDERTVARFQREAKTASRLNHPNSISILDFGQAEDGAMYIAMEFVSGKDLHHILSKEWPLPETRIVRIISQVLSALNDAHNANVVHRDLKPENIMVEQRRGDPDFVKVLDFGIAKIMDSTGEDGPALTRAGFVCGTPEYMSPEQARGAQLDHRSDLYAVGVILYQLTSGMLPFDSDSAVGFATKHLTEQPPLPSVRRPEAKISPGMERLIMKSLSKSPDHRPQTAEQFRAELQAIDKERRATLPSRRGSSLAGAAAPRRVTPLDQQETRVGVSGAWGTEKTERAEPIKLVKATVAADVTTSDAKPLNERPTGGRPELTERLDPRPARGTQVFKGVTVLMIAVAVGVLGFFLFEKLSRPKVDPVKDPPPITNKAQVNLEKLYAEEIPQTLRNIPQSKKLLNEGDASFHQDNWDLAITKYKEAFIADPRPEIALRLGEIYFQRGNEGEAQNWWNRMRRDDSTSKARSYVDQVSPPASKE